jgi:hypothetical protein
MSLVAGKSFSFEFASLQVGAVQISRSLVTGLMRAAEDGGVAK